MDPVIELTEAQILNIEALYQNDLESKDAESVRRATAALLATPGGVAFLTMHGLVQ